MDFELTETIAVEDFRDRLVAQLPSDTPIYHLEEVAIKSLAATRLLDQAEYLITVKTEETYSREDWQNWLDAVKNTSRNLLGENDEIR